MPIIGNFRNVYFCVLMIGASSLAFFKKKKRKHRHNTNISIVIIFCFSLNLPECTWNYLKNTVLNNLLKKMPTKSCLICYVSIINHWFNFVVYRMLIQVLCFNYSHVCFFILKGCLHIKSECNFWQLPLFFYLFEMCI